MLFRSSQQNQVLHPLKLLINDLAQAVVTNDTNQISKLQNQIVQEFNNLSGQKLLANIPNQISNNSVTRHEPELGPTQTEKKKQI